MKNLLITLLLLAAIAGGIGYSLWNKPHADMQSQIASAKVEAIPLYNAFESDEGRANEKYLGKIIEVTGQINHLTEEENGNTKFVLEAGSMMGGIICEMNGQPHRTSPGYEVGEIVTVRGECTGYLMDVILSRCVVIE